MYDHLMHGSTMALPTDVSHRCHRASSHVGWAKEPLGSFLGRVREPVGRLRLTAIPNNDLTIVMTEIEALGMSRKQVCRLWGRHHV